MPDTINTDDMDFGTDNIVTNGRLNARKPRGSRVPPNETKGEAFVRLTLMRMPALQSKMKGIKQLAKYPHTNEQAEKIVNELKRLVDDVEAAFLGRTDTPFSF